MYKLKLKLFWFLWYRKIEFIHDLCYGKFFNDIWKNEEFGH